MHQKMDEEDDAYFEYDDYDDTDEMLVEEFFDVNDDDDDSTVSNKRRRNRKRDDLMKMVDTGFALYGGKVAYFHTSTNPGSTIRNAVTGIYESGYLVGSVNEDLFFKVAFTTNATKQVLFYDSPEQYERHFGTTNVCRVKWSARQVTDGTVYP